jgi:hypothetical protein
MGDGGSSRLVARSMRGPSGQREKEREKKVFLLKFGLECFGREAD